MAQPLFDQSVLFADAQASRIARRALSVVATGILAVASVGCATGQTAAHFTLPASANEASLAPRIAVVREIAAVEVASITPSDDRVATAQLSVAWTLSAARCPADMALVGDRVCVDRWENALVEQIPGVGERLWASFLPPDGHESSLRAVSRPGVVPQGYISGVQARTMCEASGKHLCSPGEWDQACRGSAHTQFPYGNQREARVCNDDIRAVHPVAEVGLLVGLAPAEWWTEGMNNPLINQLESGLLPTGERSGCTNDYGVYDMVGNLHEWVDDPEGAFRGGYYMDTTLNGEGCSYQTTAHDFDYHDYSTGFRCCMDPDRVE